MDTYKRNSDEYDRLLDIIYDLKNELCLKCGKYELAHEGACDGCRWEGLL